MITALIVIGSVIAYLLVGACIAGLTLSRVDRFDKEIHILSCAFVWPLFGTVALVLVAGEWIATRIDDAITARAERRKGGAA